MDECFLVLSQEGQINSILISEKAHKNGHDKSKLSPAHTVSYFQQDLQAEPLRKVEQKQGLYPIFL